MWKVYDNDDEDDYDDKNDDNGQRTNFGSEKVTWAFGSDELKTRIVLKTIAKLLHHITTEPLSPFFHLV